MHGPGGVHGPGGCMVPGGAWSGGECVHGPWGVCVHGPGGVPGGDPPMATAMGGTHPTGMHSCQEEGLQINIVNATACTVIVKDRSIIPLRIHHCI